MSDFTYQPLDVQEPSNGLAIAGFICSLLGVVTGILAPIGVILCLVALGKPGGKGFAISGLIIGLLVSCGGLVLGVIFFAGILAAVGIGLVTIALAEPEKLELTSDMVNIAIAVKMYEEEQGVLPADLSLVSLRESVKNDPWGNPYAYHFIEDDPGFDIISKGEDGLAGTEDDVQLTRLDETWEAAGNIVFDADADDDSGTITFTIGDNVFTVHGDEEGGRITLNLGDRILEITGGDDGANITVTSSGEGDSEPDSEPDSETDSQEDPPANQSESDPPNEEGDSRE